MKETISKSDVMNTEEKWSNEHNHKVMDWTLWKSEWINTVKKWWTEHFQKVMEWTFSKMIE
jgi:hypothetical protein